jgi:hypothetical protein
MDKTGSESCPTESFINGSIKSSGSRTTKMITRIRCHILCRKWLKIYRVK